ncbi:hypothetical protein B0H11DRAFT_1929491 [Mycena galericulata]|nr:hypothetical protein B0H11DRAFT_1929491 [Mycena galericulata]
MEQGSLPAMMGLDCHKCWKEMDVQLPRCGGCRRISYCSTERTLTIHILGANIREVSYGRVFEEILHRNPGVEILKVCDSLDHKVYPDCMALDRSYVLEYAAESVLATILLLLIIECICSTYHDFVEKQGNKLEKPDLCIGFNSGASQVPTYKWPTTFKLLIEHKLPGLFTAYNRVDAAIAVHRFIPRLDLP